MTLHALPLAPRTIARAEEWTNGWEAARSLSGQDVYDVLVCHLSPHQLHAALEELWFKVGERYEEEAS